MYLLVGLFLSALFWLIVLFIEISDLFDDLLLSLSSSSFLKLISSLFFDLSSFSLESFFSLFKSSLFDDINVIDDFSLSSSSFPKIEFTDLKLSSFFSLFISVFIDDVC